MRAGDSKCLRCHRKRAIAGRKCHVRQESTRGHRMRAIAGRNCQVQHESTRCRCAAREIVGKVWFMRPVTRRRDRHGRGPRGPLLPPGIPARLTWRQSFDQIVAWNAQEILARHPEISRIEIGIDEAPKTDPASWESHQVVMCRVFPENRLAGLAPRVVLYRLPIQARAGRASIRDLGSPLHALVRMLLVDGLAEATGLPPEELHGGPLGPIRP